jgi:hypothetical protein
VSVFLQLHKDAECGDAAAGSGSTIMRGVDLELSGKLCTPCSVMPAVAYGRLKPGVSLRRLSMMLPTVHDCQVISQPLVTGCFLANGFCCTGRYTFSHGHRRSGYYRLRNWQTLTAADMDGGTFRKVNAR